MATVYEMKVAYARFSFHRTFCAAQDGTVSRRIEAPREFSTIPPDLFQFRGLIKRALPAKILTAQKKGALARRSKDPEILAVRQQP
jgi:hypothetical protein